MIPIQDAIDSGAWFEFDCDVSNDYRATAQSNILRFRIKVKNIQKINLKSIVEKYINDSGRASGFDSFVSSVGIDANIWKVDIDIVNMASKEIRSDLFGDLIKIKDQDGCSFSRSQDIFLTLECKHEELNGLSNFFCSELPSKVKKSGAFCFELPEFFDQLYVTAKNGSIKEL
jgi:hypothetical protein